jgi:hypothetical protein
VEERPGFMKGDKKSPPVENVYDEEDASINEKVFNALVKTPRVKNEKSAQPPAQSMKHHGSSPVPAAGV